MKKQIVEAIRNEVMRRGLTYRDLSTLMGGVSLSLISSAFNQGNPTLDTLIKMCEALDMELVVRKK